MPIFSTKNKKYIESTEWVKQHSYGIESLNKCEDHEFDFLIEVLNNKRIVWLGENGHGVAEHSLLKSRLIHFLYYKMGFKVIAFESGLSEGYSSNYLKKELSIVEIMEKSVFSLWKSKETLSLFELVKENYDLNLIGFDFQPSVKQSLFHEYLEKVNMDFPTDFLQGLKKVEEGASFWYECIGSYRAVSKRIPRKVLNEFLEASKEIEDVIDYLQNTLNNLREGFINKNMDKEFAVIQKVLENKRHFFNHITTKRSNFLKIRDQIMADNLTWICNDLYPNEKVIVWAHNNHIYKNIKSSYKPMGSLMSPELEDQSYHLGFYMYEGDVTFDKKTSQKLNTPPKKSLEDYMNHTSTPVSFLDFSQLSSNRLNKWLYSPTVILDSGMMQTLIIPCEQLDGILFIKKVSPPNYL
ncbi:erythromycin esterase family protein [Cytobacillus sp. FJAT-54145]|uniref:Erythromycin esterase family protein n=1 Tax=Cytobacillus spartinae TaxID=3299023 RepID=A0ABW6KF24_9BACI